MLTDVLLDITSGGPATEITESVSLLANMLFPSCVYAKAMLHTRLCQDEVLGHTNRPTVMKKSQLMGIVFDR